jgi:small conductance mechanosensitive channel
VREAPEVPEFLEVGTVPRPYPLRGWVIGILAGAVTLAALIVGSMYGNAHAASFNPKLVAWVSAAVIVGAGIVATTRLSTAVSHMVARRNAPAFEGAVKFISAAVGYLFVAFSALAVLDVSVERLLVGAGLAGVVLGIAAQQSLGNIFAGLVLILARPFVVGDHIRIRSGALGGIFDAWVLEMSLTYVTVRTDDGQLKIPNTAMLAAGVGKIPPEGLQPKPAAAAPAQTAPVQATPAQTAPAPAAPAQPGLVSTDGGQAASAQGIMAQSGDAQTDKVGTAAAPGAAQAGAAQAGATQPVGADKPKRARVTRPRASRTTSNRAKSDPVPPATTSGPEAQ